MLMASVEALFLSYAPYKIDTKNNHKLCSFRVEACCKSGVAAIKAKLVGAGLAATREARVAAKIVRKSIVSHGS